MTHLASIFQDLTIDTDLKAIAQKVIDKSRITPEEALVLYEKGDIAYLGALANHIREERYGDQTFFNRNFHIEPTNVCVFSCAFCAYSKLYKHREEGWELSIEQMMHIVKKYDGIHVTEVHIVGGVHPKLDLSFFCDLLRQIHAYRPDLHLKGFTAVELDYMFRKSKLTRQEGLQQLKDAGLQSLPGGGAEIFAPAIRKQICEDKIDGAGWLDIHKTAHQLGMHSNATMLYGHIEHYTDRIDHMNQLRLLQDETKGFNCFIPLKFRNQDNDMSHIPETTLIEDIKAYAIARIFLDNFAHVKAYWPMLGRNHAQLMLNFGVDDLDGTIDDSTKIYSMAGSEEQNPAMSTEQLCSLITDAKRIPVERDSIYNILRVYENEQV
ncbi:MAG: aminofutalosine synthase MqnE [Bacteroidetes bacterium]|jgi:aminodeoxyfutalosine synthase|nr:aminofutalosine synthase MqnE [Bacteroidota bacterium]MBK9301619.1 aminofutalosine synthase MqnE [Bacteroidota bacterium]MBK9481742.1 aminofutalosine synthase MqnE [Bacteroidota bacterium]